MAKKLKKIKKGKNILDNPFFIFFLLLFAVSVSFISSIHFLVILFAGVLSNLFYRTIRQKYYYSLAFVIIAFLIIELNIGLKPFSLSLISLFMYIFIVPKYEDNHTSGFLYILIFYLVLSILWLIFFNFEIMDIYTLIVNIIIDIVLFGIFVL